ncbi:MAG: tetratricopeptide repeat protein [Chitinivibrionales bacterium]|nr:tetratricopeptide repeat protein [Chitinivibrionales bacterium]
MKKASVCLFVLLTAVCSIWAVDFEFSPDEISGSDAIPSALMRTAKEAYKLNMKGLDLLESGDISGARSLFERAKETLPDYTDAINNLGVVYFRKGNIPQAEALWKSAIEEDKEYAIAYHNLGTIAFHEKKFDRAKEYFEDALDANKKLVDSHVMLGRMLLSQGERKKALKHFADAYRINPRHTASWGFYSFGLIQDGDTSRAVEVLKNNQDHPDALDMLGTIAALKGDTESAAQYLRKAFDRGASETVLLKLASIHLDKGECSRALPAVQRYITESKSPVSDAYLTAGIAAQECGNSREAQSWFEKGMERHPSDPLLRYNLGKLYFQNKSYARAGELLGSITDTLNDPELYYLRALTARKQKDYKKARSLIDKALSIDPKARYYDLFGVILYAQGEKEKAEKQFKKALSLNPSLRSAQINLTFIDKSSSELSAALQKVEEELDKCTGKCTDQALRLSVLYYHTKDVSRALQTLTRLSEKERDERVYKTMALYHREMNDFDQAIALLEKAKEQFVVGTGTLQELAELYLLAGNYSQAITTLTDVLDKTDKDFWRIYYQIGYASMKQNDHGKARLFFEKSIKANRKNVAAKGLLAYVLNEMGDESGAQKLWKQSIQDDPENPTILTNMGLALENEGNYSRALEYYQKAHRLQKENTSLLINIGNAYAGLGRSNEAFDAYRRALNSDKRELAAFNTFNLARKLNNRSKAQKMVDLLKKEFPRAENTLRAEGEAALWDGDTTAALKALTSLKDLNPDDHLSLALIYSSGGIEKKASYHLGKVPDKGGYNKKKKAVQARLAFISGNYERAIALWKELQDTSFGIQYNMAVAALETKDYQNALAAAVELADRASHADRADVWRVAGNAAFGLKEWELAKKWYSKLSMVTADDPVVYYNMAVADYNTGDIDESWKYYKKAQQMKPSLKNKDIENRYAAAKNPRKPVTKVVVDSLDEMYNTALTLQSQGKVGEAEEVYYKIVTVDKNHTRAWNNLGAIYAAQGELEKAEECYLNAVKKNHDLPEAYVNLVNIYLALEKVSDAKKWVFKGLHYHPDSNVLRQMEQRVDQKLKD